MLPESLLNFSVQGGQIAPQYLDERDHPWLRNLVEEFERFVGRPERELDERLREPLSCDSPLAKRRVASHVLRRLWLADALPKTRVAPRRAREVVFGLAARAPMPLRPAAVIAEASASLGVAAAKLEAALFADLAGERIVGPPPARRSPSDLALRCNLALIQGLLFRAARVEIEALGNARALVRHARLRGLICTPWPRERSVVLELSGPFALFRRTLLYGKRLAELVPQLAWCERFRLRAQCVVRGREFLLEVRSGDPILPAAEPRRYDSRLEERFARDFRRVAPEWDLIREPEPVPAGNTLIFPDFALQHRHDPARHWLLEIVGFWTPAYIERKLTHLRALPKRNLIVCVGEDLNCAPGDLPPGLPVVRFRRRVDVAAVLGILEGRAQWFPPGAGL